jgi:NhaP-type Na+/H+ or K+/H+ antiporter
MGRKTSDWVADMDEQLLIFYLAGVPLLGVLAQWLAWRLRVPSILLLLAFGILLGHFIELDGLLARLADSDESLGRKLLSPVVALSVAVILFEGGLTLRFHELKDAGRGVLRLVTLGALISWLLTALAAWRLLGFDPQLAILLGAILVVTGPTVVAPILRQIRPERRVGSMIKWEGIVIDPIGAVLAVLVFEVVFAGAGHNGMGHAAMILVRTVAIGGVVGTATAWLLVVVLRRYWLPDYLHGVAFLTVALAVFTISDWLQHESGLVTVTVLGVLLANQKQISIRHVVEFKEHLGVFLISCLFIVLGSRLNVADLFDLGWGGVAFIAAMILVVRPVSVMLAMLGDKTRWSERVLLAFLAPRGIVAAAVSSVFALEVGRFLASGGESTQLLVQTDRLVAVTFLVIVSTVATYGLLAGPLARWLGVADPNPQGVLFAGADPWVRSLAELLQEADFQVLLVDTNYSHVAEARMQGLPSHCASILSEFVEEEMDLNGIGRMLAVTPNEEVNALAVREMAHVFGRRNVYQISPGGTGSGRRSVGGHLRGRLLFQEGLGSVRLTEMLMEGAAIKKTSLSEEFNYEDFRQMYGQAAVVLFLIDGKGNLRICAADEPISPESGDTLLALVPRKPQDGTGE